MMNGAIHHNENLIVCMDLYRKHYDPFMTDLWMHHCMRVKRDNISHQHNNPLREQRFTCESLRAAHNNGDTYMHTHSWKLVEIF